MPIRVGGATVAPGSQVTRIVSIRLGDRQERDRERETHQLNKQMAHIKMDGGENVEKLCTKNYESRSSG